MNMSALSDKAIKQALGGRFRALRLSNNVTQQELAASTALSLNTIKALETGSGKLSTAVAVLRALGALDHLDIFIPATSACPPLPEKKPARPRQRASGKSCKPLRKNEAIR